MQHLYMIPTYGSLKDTTEIDIKDNIENLIKEGFLLKNSLPDFYSKKILVLTKKAQKELSKNRREIKSLLIKYFRNHYSTLLQKGEKYLHLPTSQDDSLTKGKRNWQTKMKALKSKYPRYGEPWSELEREKAIEMYKKGTKVKEISSELGRNGNSIRSVLRKNGILDNISSSPRNIGNTDMHIKEDLYEELIIGEKPEIIDENNIHLAFRDIEYALDNIVKIEGGNGLTPKNAIKYLQCSPDYYPSYDCDRENLEQSILKNFFKIFGIKYVSIVYEDTFFDRINEKVYEIYRVNIEDKSIRYFFDVTQEMAFPFELLDFYSNQWEDEGQETNQDNTVRYEESIEDEDEDGDDEEAYESIAYEKEDKFQEFGSEAYYYPYEEDEDEDGDDEDGMHWDGDEWVSN